MINGSMVSLHLLNEATRTGIHALVPNDAISQAAYEHVRSNLDPVILNHSLRTFLYALATSEKEQLPWHEPMRQPLLFVAAVFHDMGTTHSCDGPQRFEVEGADAAVAFLQSHGVPDHDAHEVWVAIACHTCSGIAERISSMARCVRLGVLVDFKRPSVVAVLDADFVARVEAALPRDQPEKVLSEMVVEQALRQPSKAAAATSPGVMTRFAKENPEWQGVNKEF